MTLQQVTTLLKAAGTRWSERNAPRLGASLAYYSLLSLAPLLVFVVAICGLVFKQNAEQQLLNQVRHILGASGTNTIKTLLDNAHKPGSGIVATVIAFVTLLFGASGVFVELRDSLNTIWDAPAPPEMGWRTFVRQRLVAFGMVLALGLLLMVSLMLTAAASIAERFFDGFIPVHFAVVGHIGNFLLTLIGISILFALIFKFVPNVPIDWRDVLIGAVVTAILFTIGRELLALYLTTLGVGSTYGAAGSLVALVVWVYYSAQIFFFGAVITKIYADSYGSKAIRSRVQNQAPRSSQVWAGRS